MTLYDFTKAKAELKKGVDINDIYTSPDFQCDQTGGFPVSLCVLWNKGKAWLELNETLVYDRDSEVLDSYEKLCAEFGIRDCHDTEDFNNILKELGEDAYQTAWIPDDDEGINLC